MRWYRASKDAEVMSREERKDAVYALQNAELAPIVRKFHDRGFRGWMTTAERATEEKRQLRQQGTKIIANTPENRERLAVAYVSAVQREREPREFYEDHSGEWLLVEIDPLIMPPELPWRDPILVADSSGYRRAPLFGDLEDEDEDEAPHEEARDVGIPVEDMALYTGGEKRWYDDHMSATAARYGSEFRGWEWNPWKRKMEPRFEVATPIGRFGSPEEAEAEYSDSVTPWLPPKVAADWLAKHDAAPLE